MRVLVAVLCLALAGCSLPVDDLSPLPKYVPPVAPSLKAQLSGAKTAAAEELIADNAQMSDLRASDSGPGRYILCLSGRRGTGDLAYYSVYFDNDDYKGSRPSVIGDLCEKQSYRPVN
jgi:hypothetical protein